MTIGPEDTQLDDFSVQVYCFGDPESNIAWGDPGFRSYEASGWEELDNASSKGSAYSRNPNEMPGWYQEWWDRLFEGLDQAVNSFRKRKPYNKD